MADVSERAHHILWNFWHGDGEIWCILHFIFFAPMEYLGNGEFFYLNHLSLALSCILVNNRILSSFFTNKMLNPQIR